MIDHREKIHDYGDTGVPAETYDGLDLIDMNVQSYVQ